MTDSGSSDSEYNVCKSSGFGVFYRMPSQTQARKVLKNEIVVMMTQAPAATRHIIAATHLTQMVTTEDVRN